ncbi:hypothetical protein [Marinobacter alexandrii]|uniref:hypothetical protein n=1 Tax=Marinobacter alexandrii TaxID=2570351 RepID=UPI0032985D6F
MAELEMGVALLAQAGAQKQQNPHKAGFAVESWCPEAESNHRYAQASVGFNNISNLWFFIGV